MQNSKCKTKRGNFPGAIFFCYILHFTFCILHCVVCARAGEPPAPDAAIGQWDGVTESAELQGPYEDKLQQEIPFGRRSYYLAPWRSYMDTWPATRFLQVPGIN